MILDDFNMNMKNFTLVFEAFDANKNPVEFSKLMLDEIASKHFIEICCSWFI